MRSDKGANDNQVQFTAHEREFVFSVAMKYMKDEDRALDVTQDALLNAFRHRASFRGDSRFTTWLYRIAATTALMHLRKERRAPRAKAPVDEDDLPIEPVDAHASPEELVAAAESVELASARLAELGDKYGSIFQLRFVEGYTETEIARKLRMNVATVKTRAYRARAQLRATLKDATAVPALPQAA